MNTRILIVEDVPTDAEINEREVRLVLPESEFLRVETREDFLTAITSFIPDLILSDYKLPHFDGMSALKLALIHAPETPFIIVTGSMNEDTAVGCMKAGAWDYIIKGHIKRLGPAIISGMEQRCLRREGRAAENSMCESEQKYRSLVDNANEAIVVVQEGLLIFVNRKAADITGYPEPDLMMRPFSEFIFPADRDMVVENYKKRLDGERVSPRYEFRLLNIDGTAMWVELSAVLIDWKGKPATLIFLIEITERKRAEEEREGVLVRRNGVNLLQQSLLAPAPLERKLKNITDSIVRIFGADFCRIWLIRPGDLCERGCTHARVREGPHVCRNRERCLYLMSSSGRYVHIDGEGHRRVPFGCYKIGRIASGEEHKFITDDVRNDPLVHNHEWARELGLVSFAGYQLRVPDGETLGVLGLFAKHPILPADDAMLDGISSTVAIVIKQAEAESALRESEERYRTLFDDAKDGIALADAETGRLIECNQALCRMVERDKQELVGQLQSILHPPQPLTNGKSVSFITHNSGDPGIVHEEQLIAKSGKLITVEIKATRVLMNEHNYLLGIFRDISERKLLEKEKMHLNSQLFQAQKMEAVGALAGGVAHDFNNLLTAIGGFISLAMMKLEESDPVHRDLKQAGLATVRAGGVVRQLLLFSRKQPMEFLSLHLNETITNLLKMLNRLIGEDIAIDTQLDPDNCIIQGDEGNIEQVIMNLVVNARDAMPQGGKIAITTENVHIGEEYCMSKNNARPGEYALLSITDTGTGMDAATLSHLFEPFFTTKAKGKGTGLGLSVVYGIVKQHNGWIDVESNPGQGTTFNIHLPSSYINIIRKTTEVFRIENYQGKGERILVVEDQNEVRELAIELLKENGYTVFHAENAERARELFTREKGEIDLVFSDIVLPDVSGFRLVEELSSIRKLRVIFTSGYTDDKAGLDTIQKKNHRFLQKPYSMQSLLMAVRETLEIRV